MWKLFFSINWSICYVMEIDTYIGWELKLKRKLKKKLKFQILKKKSKLKKRENRRTKVVLIQIIFTLFFFVRYEMLKKRSKNDNFGGLLGERILVKILWRCGRWVISCTESASLRSGRNCREMVPLSAGSLTSLLDSSISANSIRLISCFWSISISLFFPIQLRFWIVNFFNHFCVLIAAMLISYDSIITIVTILQVRSTLDRFFLNSKDELYLLQIDANKVFAITLFQLIKSHLVKLSAYEISIVHIIII